MSIGPFSGIPASAAGAPLSQIVRSDAERAQDTATQSRQASTDLDAEQAAGIGQTDEDSETSERDADGRRLWEQQARRRREERDANKQEQPPVRDPSGNSGGQLDLSG